MGKYYRVETKNLLDGSVEGGFFSCAHAIGCIIGGVKPTCTPEELFYALRENGGLSVNAWLSAASFLSECPVPDVYSKDKENNFCLYKEKYYIRASFYLEELDALIRVYSQGMYGLIYKEIEGISDDVRYSDEYQIVISKDAYTSCKDISEHDRVVRVL